MEQNDYLRLVEESKKQELLEAKEKKKALKLAAGTNNSTIPVVKLQLKEIKGVTMHSWDYFWDHKAIDLHTPIIMERSKNIIGGPMQYFEAEEKGQKSIDAIYIDSLANKEISAKNLEKQFKNKNVAMSFAYSLYACISDMCDIITFSDFCECIYDNLSDYDIKNRIANYIAALDEEVGI